MSERWSYPVAQAMQRHTGSRYVKPVVAPPMAPEQAPDLEVIPVSPPLAEDAGNEDRR